MRAVTRTLHEWLGDDAPVPDLNDIARDDGLLLARDGQGVAGRGEAVRLNADDASTWLAGLDHDSTVDDAAPLALGFIPFRPGHTAEVIVPEVAVVKRNGHCWVTAVGDDVDVAAALTPGPEPTPTAPSWSITPGVDVDRYLAAVTAARDAVRAGSLTKAVIARPIIVSADQPISIHAVLRRLKLSFGSSYRSSIDGMVGASPELLIAVEGDTVQTLILR